MIYYFYNDYIHQVVGNIYYAFLEFITTEVTSRFKSKTITTYNKAIQLLKQNSEKEIDHVIKLPAISLDPTEPLKFEEKSNALWRTPVSKLSKRLFTPIYQDDNFRITPGFVRYTTTIDIYCWFDSIYEQIDTELRFLQVFHNINRWSKPFGMEVACPLPEKLYIYTDTDDQGQEININWQSNITPLLLETINKEVPTLTMYLAPMIKLNDLASLETRDKDSGEDLATCAFQASFEIEFEIPTFFLLDTFWQIRHIDTQISDTNDDYNWDYIDNQYSSNSQQEPDEYQNRTSTDTITSEYMVPGGRRLCNVIPTIKFTLDPSGDTNPASGIIVPQQVVVSATENTNSKVVASYVMYVDKTTEKIEIPSGIDYDYITLLYKGNVLPFEQKQGYIYLQDELEGFLLLILSKEET